MNVDLFYLLIPVVMVELVLMMYVYQLRPFALSNRLFAAFMLSLVSYHSGVLMSVTAVTDNIVRIGVWLQALGTLTSGLFLWLLLLAIYPRRTKIWRISMGGVGLLVVINLVGLLVDAGFGTNIIIDLDRISLANPDLGFISGAAGLTGQVLFWFSSLAFVFIPLPLVYFALSRRTAPNLRRPTQVLAMLALFALGLYWVFSDWPVIWRTLSTMIIVGGGMAFVVSRYRFLSPVALGWQQALDSAMFGVLLFGTDGAILEINHAARLWLDVAPQARAWPHLGDFLVWLRPFTENRIDPDTLLHDLPVQIPLTINGRYLIVRIESIKNEEGLHAGTLVGLQNNTTERRLLEEMREINQLLQSQITFATTLNEITTEAIGTASNKDLYQLFTNRIANLFHADYSYLTMWDEARNLPIPVSAFGREQKTYAELEIHKYKDEPTLTASVLAAGKPLLIPDVQSTPYLGPNLAKVSPKGSVLALPLVANQRKLGAVLVGYEQPRGFSAEEVQQAEQMAGQLALVLARNELLVLEREQRLVAETLHQLSLNLSQTLEVAKIYDLLIDGLFDVVPYDTANIMILDDGWLRMIVERSPGYEWPAEQHIHNKALRLRPEEVITFRRMMETKRPFIISNTKTSTEWLSLPGTGHIASWAGAPILVNGEPVAFFSIDKLTQNFYQPKHRDRLAAIAAQASLALQNATLFQQTQKHAERMITLNALSAIMTRMTTVQALCTAVTQELQAQFKYQRVTIYLLDPDRQNLVLQAMSGLDADQYPPGSYSQSIELGLLGYTARTATHVIANDTRQHDLFFPCAGTDILSECALPIIANGQAIGVLDINSEQTNSFNQADVFLLITIADQLAIALTRANLFEETQQHLQELQLLSELSAALRSVTTTAEILPLVMHFVMAALHFDNSVIMLREGPELVSRYSLPENFYPPGLTHPLEIGISGMVASTGKLYQTTDLQSDERFITLPHEPEILDKMKSLVSIPLYAEQRVIGVMNLGAQKERMLQPSELRLLNAIGDMAANALHRADVLATLEDRVQARTAELATANEQLQELDRLKNKFIADMSHELRTPVANLVLYLDLLQHGRPEQRERYMTVLREKGRQLVRLTEDILSISRLDMRRERPQMVSVDLNEVVRLVCDGHKHQAAEKNLVLQVDLEPELPKVMAEPNQIAQALTHLLTNAILYTQQGSISVATGLTRAGEVMLVVSDTGVGIPEKDMPHLFQRFYRGQRVGQLDIPGTGLGLAVVQEVVALHRGQVKVESEEGVGTTFTIILPSLAKDTAVHVEKS